jgi:hypothetical protein
MDLTKLNKHSKKDPIPGTTSGYADKNCPICGKRMLIFKPCCGNPNGYIGCCDLSCGYKEAI